jgi:hypothetical protein
MSEFEQETKDHYLNTWRDSVNAINNATAPEGANADIIEAIQETIQANKDHLAMLISFDWFTDGITGTELDEIEAALA